MLLRLRLRRRRLLLLLLLLLMLMLLLLLMLLPLLLLLSVQLALALQMPLLAQAGRLEGAHATQAVVLLADEALALAHPQARVRAAARAAAPVAAGHDLCQGEPGDFFLAVSFRKGE